MGSLIVAEQADGVLHHRGRVASGLDRELRQRLRAKLLGLEQEEVHPVGAPRLPKRTRWVLPVITAAVRARPPRAAAGLREAAILSLHLDGEPI